MAALATASSCAALVLGFSTALLVAVSSVPVLVLLLLDRPRLAVLVATASFLLPEGVLPASLASPLELGLLGLAGLAWVRSVSRPDRSLLLTAPLLLLVLYFAWAVSSTMWAEQPQVSRRELVAYGLSLVLLFLLLNVVATHDDLDALMKMLAWVGWLLVLAGLASLLVTGLDTGGRLRVLETNANQYGNTLLLTSAGVLWTARQSRSRHARLLSAPCFLVLVLSLIGLTASRGSLLAFCILLLALLTTASGRRVGLRTVGLSVVVAAAVGPLLFSTTFERFREPATDEIGRGILWAAGWDVVTAYPLHGVGVGNGPYAVPPYVDARADRNFFVHGREQYPAHNPFIEVAADTGLVGVSLFAAALAAAAGGLIVTVRRASRADEGDVVAFGAVVGAASLGFLFAWSKSGGASANITTYVLLALWGLAACAGPSRLTRTPRLRAAVVRAV